MPVLRKRKALLQKQRVIRKPSRTVARHKLTPPSNMVMHLQKNPTARVCVIRSVGGIGDVVMTTPALRELKNLFPECHLTYAVDRHRTNNDLYYELVKNLRFIDEVVDARYVDRDKFGFVSDISAVCIRHEYKGMPDINRIDLFARHLGITRLRNNLPAYLVEKSERAWAKSKIEDIKAGVTGPVIAVHTASNEGKRSWPLSHSKALVRALRASYPQGRVVVFDYNHKDPLWQTLDGVYDASSLDVRRIAALIQQCDFFVGPDSGLMHLAGAVRTRSLVLFGSIPPQARINYYPTHSAITADVNCLGCWYATCKYDTKCMKTLSAQSVLKEISEDFNVFCNRT